MLKKLGILVLGSAVALSLVACGDSTKEASNEKKKSRSKKRRKRIKKIKKVRRKLQQLM